MLNMNATNFIGYKNAPHIQPKIGDIVENGVRGTAIVRKISVDELMPERPRVINCAFDGNLHLNMASEAVLVVTVDGIKPKPL